MSDEEEILSEERFLDDPIAQRAMAIANLLATLDALKNEELRKEGMLMATAVRRSIKTPPQAELIPVRGGKDPGSAPP